VAKSRISRQPAFGIVSLFLMHRAAQLEASVIPEHFALRFAVMVCLRYSTSVPDSTARVEVAVTTFH
jgi:hypothetical protein